MKTNLSKEQKVYFRDLFREARAKALSNAENFEDIIFALEKLGSFLLGKIEGLGQYQNHICKLAKKSVLADQIPKKLSGFHTDFESLYDLVKDARNSAMHEGVFARNLTQHAIEISLILENALMSQEVKVKNFMIRNPVCAFDWQPISFIRQNMLANSFSYLPILHNGEWKLISDLAVSKYIQESSSKAERKKRLSKTFKESGIKPIETRTVDALVDVKEIMNDWNGFPICVTSKDTKEIVGILTPFDLL